jgi:hypothetical protein
LLQFGHSQVSKKLPMPDAEAQTKAEKLIKDLFKDDYAKKNSSDLLALATKLLEQARETKDDPAAKFVLYREARDLAARAGEPGQALQIVNETAKEFAIDMATMKATALETATSVATTPASFKTIVDQALAAIDELVFPVVVVCGFEPGTYADPADFEDLAVYQERLRNERRLLYVGMSRAMRGLMVSVQADCQHEALLELPPEHWHLEVVS